MCFLAPLMPFFLLSLRRSVARSILLSPLVLKPKPYYFMCFAYQHSSAAECDTSRMLPNKNISHAFHTPLHDLRAHIFHFIRQPKPATFDVGGFISFLFFFLDSLAFLSIRILPLLLRSLFSLFSFTSS